MYRIKDNSETFHKELLKKYYAGVQKCAVLITCNNNKDYYQWIPYVIKAWEKLNINPVIVFINNKLPTILYKYKSYIRLWEPIKDINSGLQAQILRLYYPAILSEYDKVIISDVDLLPIPNKEYWQLINNLPKDTFLAMRFKDNQYYMPFNVAHPLLWSKLFNIYSLLDIRKHNV